MGEIKNSQQADGVGFLYRCAFALAKGQIDLGQSFLITASAKIPTFCDQSLCQLLTQKNLIDQKNALYWAEKILDEYKSQLYLLQTATSPKS